MLQLALAHHPPTAKKKKRETKKVIAREDGYIYIAALRSPDLRQIYEKNKKNLGKGLAIHGLGSRVVLRR